MGNLWGISCIWLTTPPGDRQDTSRLWEWHPWEPRTGMKIIVRSFQNIMKRCPSGDAVVPNAQADPDNIRVPVFGSLRHHFQGFLFLEVLLIVWQTQRMPQFWERNHHNKITFRTRTIWKQEFMTKKYCKRCVTLRLWRRNRNEIAMALNKISNNYAA